MDIRQSAPYSGECLINLQQQTMDNIRFYPPSVMFVCFGFLTYLLLLVVESFPSQNDGAPILEAVDSLGDDAAIIACTLSRASSTTPPASIADELASTWR